MLVLYLVYCLGCVGRRVLVAVLTSSSPPGCVGNTLPPRVPVSVGTRAAWVVTLATMMLVFKYLPSCCTELIMLERGLPQQQQQCIDVAAESVLELSRHGLGGQQQQHTAWVCWGGVCVVPPPMTHTMRCRICTASRPYINPLTGPHDLLCCQWCVCVRGKYTQ